MNGMEMLEIHRESNEERERDVKEDRSFESWQKAI
jgi:hypothetical protein